ncbi:eukaryotic translation initiation factor 2B, subunit 2 beta, 39kDa, partial [Piptocephalis cylindrospora]
NIATQAAEHIHENEIILTMGRSLTVEAFLKAAAKKRRFQVVVAETGPDFQGHAQALALTKHGIQTTVISDAAVFAVMSRMNKVLLEAHTVLANGGVLAVAGSRLMAEAATVHKTPVMLAASAFQLSPETLFDPSTHTECISPSHLLPSLEAIEGGMVDEVNPVREYVPPSSIDLYLTNVGAHPTSYLTRLISENYHVQDTYLGW